MKSYKLLTEQIGETLRKLKAERGENIKEIKSVYSQLEGKQSKPFDQVVDRIGKNLQFFKETEYRNSIGSINSKDIIHKYDGKLHKINEQITKLDRIIKNGCGNIIQKPPTSRLRVEESHHNESSPIQHGQSHIEMSSHIQKRQQPYIQTKQ